MVGANNAGALQMFLSSLSCPVSDQEMVFKHINDAAPSLSADGVERILILLADRRAVVNGDGEEMQTLLDAFERTMPERIERMTETRYTRSKSNALQTVHAWSSLNNTWSKSNALQTFHAWSSLNNILSDSSTKKAVKQSHAIALLDAAISIARCSHTTLLNMAPLYDSTLFNHVIKLVPEMDHRTYAQEVNRIIQDDDAYLGIKFFFHPEFLNHFSHTARWLAEYDQPGESVILPPSVRQKMYHVLQDSRHITIKIYGLYRNITHLLNNLVSQRSPDSGNYIHLLVVGALLPTEDEVKNYIVRYSRYQSRDQSLKPTEVAEIAARYTRLKSLIGLVRSEGGKSISRNLFDDLVQASLAADAIPLAQCVTPVSGPIRKQGSAGSLFDYGLFTIHHNKDAKKSAIEIDGRVYEQSIPRRNDPFRKHRSLPGQSLGTCYVIAALNAVLNETVFVKGMLKFLEEELSRSAYSRKKGETNEQVNARRFGQQLAADITMSRDPGNMDSNVMSEVFEVISSNKEIFMWSRNVILYHTLKRSLEGGRGGYESSSSFDSRTSLFMKDWSLDRDIQNKFNEALEQIDGGQWQHALEDIFTLSGIHTLVRGRTLLATVPRTGETLCIGEHGSTPDQNGSFTGILRMRFHNSSSGHANAWIDNSGHANAWFDNSVREIIESNTGAAESEEDNKSWWQIRGKTVSSQYWASAFTCVRGDTRARFRGGERPGENISETDTARATRAIYQAAVIAPTDVSTLATCDNEKCEIGDDLKAALLTVGAFVTHHEPPRVPGTAVGGRPSPAAIPAISAVPRTNRSIERRESPLRSVGGDDTSTSSWPITMTALSAVVAVLAACADNVN